MELLASLSVAKPQSIAAVAIVFFVAYCAVRFTAFRTGRRSRPLLVTSAAWALYAGWEWLVLVKAPEANIRVDLLVVWPALMVLSAWALFRAFR
jgi:hypothetical protein